MIIDDGTHKKLAGKGFQLIRSKPRRYWVPEECTIFFQSGKPFYSFPQETHNKLFLLYLEVYGAVIAVFYIRINLSVHDPGRQIIGHVHVVNSPSLIIQSHRRETLTPPAIPVWFRMFYPEAVCPPALQKFIHPCSFGRQKS